MQHEKYAMCQPLSYEHCIYVHVIYICFTICNKLHRGSITNTALSEIILFIRTSKRDCLSVCEYVTLLDPGTSRGGARGRRTYSGPMLGRWGRKVFINMHRHPLHIFCRNNATSWWFAHFCRQKTFVVKVMKKLGGKMVWTAPSIFGPRGGLVFLGIWLHILIH